MVGTCPPAPRGPCTVEAEAPAWAQAERPPSALPGAPTSVLSPGARPPLLTSRPLRASFLARAAPHTPRTRRVCDAARARAPSRKGRGPRGRHTRPAHPAAEGPLHWGCCLRSGVCSDQRPGGGHPPAHTATPHAPEGPGHTHERHDPCPPRPLTEDGWCHQPGSPACQDQPDPRPSASAVGRAGRGPGAAPV